MRATRALGMGLAAGVIAAVAILALSAADRVPAEARRLADAARSDFPAILGDCHFDARDDVRGLKPASCNSRPAVAPSYAVWGDSHALAWQPFVWHLAEMAGASAAPLTFNSCPPAQGRAESTDSCERFNHLAIGWLERSAVDTLVVAQRWPIGYSGTGTPQQLADRVAGLSSALDRLGHLRRILVIGPLPTLRQSAPDCIALGWEATCSSPAPAHRRRVERAWRELEVLASRHPNVELVDPTGYFCDDQLCPPVRHGFGLYWDSNHITASASRGFAEAYLSDPARYTRCPGDVANPTDSP